MILYFLNKHFGDKDKLITPMKPLEIETDLKIWKIFSVMNPFKEDCPGVRKCGKLGYTSPLVNAYMSLSPQCMFGTATLWIWRC